MVRHCCLGDRKDTLPVKTLAPAIPIGSPLEDLWRMLLISEVISGKIGRLNKNSVSQGSVFTQFRSGEPVQCCCIKGHLTSNYAEENLCQNCTDWNTFTEDTLHSVNGVCMLIPLETQRPDLPNPAPWREQKRKFLRLQSPLSFDFVFQFPGHN